MADTAATEPCLAHRPLAVNLRNFEFCHGDIHEVTSPEGLFIGRKHINNKIVSILKSTKEGRGSYLIAGYRGVGKTAIFKRAYYEYSEARKLKEEGLFKCCIRRLSHKTSIPILLKINLGNRKQLDSKNIYYAIANILKSELDDVTCGSDVFRCIFTVISAILLTLLLVANLFFHQAIPNIFIPFYSTGISCFLLLFIISILTLFMAIFLSCRAKHPISKLNKLIERLENEVSHNQSVGAKSTGIIASIGKKIKSYPCHSMELEHKIIDILNKLREKNYDIVFVFDELDKLSEKGLENSEDSQEIVDGLLRSIKNFITGAKARFFFISGRETIDSYYSERGSANSLYESLFDQVIEIPSLLTDNDGEYEGPSPIARQTERYVCARLGFKADGSPYSSLNEFHVEQLNPPSDKDKDEIKDIHLATLVLRHFIYYLTFHSWGNPKRLAAIFESFLVPEESGNKRRILINAPVYGEPKSYSLQFNFDQQRTLALTASIFTLFQHQLSREVAVIGDKPTVTALSSLQFILIVCQRQSISIARQS